MLEWRVLFISLLSLTAHRYGYSNVVVLSLTHSLPHSLSLSLPYIPLSPAVFSLTPLSGLKLDRSSNFVRRGERRENIDPSPPLLIFSSSLFLSISFQHTNSTRRPRETRKCSSPNVMFDPKGKLRFFEVQSEFWKEILSLGFELFRS